MGEQTKIEWCDHTFNPWIGCTKVSAACDHCYAEALAKRYGWAKWGPGENRVRTSDANWRKPLAWNNAAEKAGSRRRVFCASLADVFDNEVIDLWRDNLFTLIEITPSLDWLLLTKRPQVAKKYIRNWPGGLPENVWLGTTVENQAMADLRIPILASIPSKVRFLSVEPMLGWVRATERYWEAIDWVICGGESGTFARHLDAEWARALQYDCSMLGIRFFMKQMGGARDKRGELHDLPPDLRVREFPT